MAASGMPSGCSCAGDCNVTLPFGVPLCLPVNEGQDRPLDDEQLLQWKSYDDIIRLLTVPDGGIDTEFDVTSYHHLTLITKYSSKLENDLKGLKKQRDKLLRGTKCNDSVYETIRQRSINKNLASINQVNWDCELCTKLLECLCGSYLLKDDVVVSLIKGSSIYAGIESEEEAEHYRGGGGGGIGSDNEMDVSDNNNNNEEDVSSSPQHKRRKASTLGGRNIPGTLARILNKPKPKFKYVEGKGLAGGCGAPLEIALGHLQISGDKKEASLARYGSIKMDSGGVVRSIADTAPLTDDFYEALLRVNNGEESLRELQRIARGDSDDEMDGDEEEDSDEGSGSGDDEEVSAESPDEWFPGSEDEEDDEDGGEEEETAAPSRGRELRRSTRQRRNASVEPSSRSAHEEAPRRARSVPRPSARTGAPPLQLTSVPDVVAMDDPLLPMPDQIHKKCRISDCGKQSQSGRDHMCIKHYNMYRIGSNHFVFVTSEDFNDDYQAILSSDGYGGFQIGIGNDSSLNHMKSLYPAQNLKVNPTGGFTSDYYGGEAYGRLTTKTSNCPFDTLLMNHLLHFIRTGEKRSILAHTDVRAVLAMRDRDEALVSASTQTTRTLPSLEDLFKTTAEFIMNKAISRFNIPRDGNSQETARLNQVLEALHKPSNLQRILNPQEFNPQIGGLFDVGLLFESFNLLYDEDGDLRKSFRLFGSHAAGARSKHLLLINTLIQTFPRDAARYWPNRGQDTLKVTRFLRFCRDKLQGAVTDGEQQYWDTDKQLVLDELEARRQQAKVAREAGNDNPNLQDAIDHGYSYNEFYDQILGSVDDDQSLAFDLHQLAQGQKSHILASQTYDIINKCQRNPSSYDFTSPALWDGLKQEVKSEFGYDWTMVCSTPDDELMAMSNKTNGRKDIQDELGSIMYNIASRVRDDCFMPGCVNKTSNSNLRAAGYGMNEDHQDQLTQVYGAKFDDPYNLRYNVEYMLDEIFDKCFHVCTCHHDRKVGYERSASNLQCELIYPMSLQSEHVPGNELVHNFDMFAFLVKLLAMGYFGSYNKVHSNDSSIKSSDMYYLIYDSFQLSFKDVIDWDPTKYDEIGPDNIIGYHVSSIVVGIMRKLSRTCANPNCFVDFMNTGPALHPGFHWDHEGGKTIKAAELGHYALPKLLNEVARYLSLTCAPCHGIKTWLNKNGIEGRAYDESTNRLLNRITNV